MESQDPTDLAAIGASATLPAVATGLAALAAITAADISSTGLASVSTGHAAVSSHLAWVGGEAVAEARGRPKSRWSFAQA